MTPDDASDQTSPAPPKAEELSALGRAFRERALSPDARALLRLLDELKGNYRMLGTTSRAQEERVIHLNVSESIARTWLPALAERIAEVDPDISLELDVVNSPVRDDEVIEQFVHQLRLLTTRQGGVSTNDLTRAALSELIRAEWTRQDEAADENQQVELIAHLLKNAINDVLEARKSIAETEQKIRGEK